MTTQLSIAEKENIFEMIKKTTKYAVIINEPCAVINEPKSLLFFIRKNFHILYLQNIFTFKKEITLWKMSANNEALLTMLQMKVLL